jgi:hypothetical protein
MMMVDLRVALMVHSKVVLMEFQWVVLLAAWMASW